eukprot:SAG25_NODE_116_length_14824_cov_126.788998_12_plen_120_part_00
MLAEKYRQLLREHDGRTGAGNVITDMADGAMRAVQPVQPVQAMRPVRAMLSQIWQMWAMRPVRPVQAMRPVRAMLSQIWQMSTHAHIGFIRSDVTRQRYKHAWLNWFNCGQHVRRLWRS